MNLALAWFIELIPNTWCAIMWGLNKYTHSSVKMQDVHYHLCTCTMARKQERKNVQETPHTTAAEPATTSLRNRDPQSLDGSSINILQVRENREVSLTFLGYTTKELLIEMFSQRLTQSILNSKSRQLPPPQTKTQTQATVLKCSSQQQRMYMDKWDSKTWYNLQLRLRWNEKNLFSLKPLILERLKKPRDLSAEESQIIKNNFFQRINITFVVQVARRQEPLLDTPVFLAIIISFTVQHFKETNMWKTR